MLVSFTICALCACVKFLIISICSHKFGT